MKWLTDSDKQNKFLHLDKDDDPKLLKKYRLNDKSARDFEKQYNFKLESLY